MAQCLQQLSIAREYLSHGIIRTVNGTAPYVKLVGKILFPCQAPWQQEAKASMVLFAVVMAIFTGSAIAACMWKLDSH
jgi:hypothetical protein